jgi:hypothetical protein
MLAGRELCPMGLYTRAEYDEELRQLDFADQQLSKDVAAGKLSGLDCLRAAAMLEQHRMEAKSKLMGTVWTLKDASTKPGAARKHLERTRKLAKDGGL